MMPAAEPETGGRWRRAHTAVLALVASLAMLAAVWSAAQTAGNTSRATRDSYESDVFPGRPREHWMGQIQKMLEQAAEDHRNWEPYAENINTKEVKFEIAADKDAWKNVNSIRTCLEIKRTLLV